MKQEEAIRRIGVLIKAHVELLYELVAIEERVPAGDFDSDAGRRELNQEVTVHTRKLFRVLKTKRDFEAELFGLSEPEKVTDE